MDISCFDGCGYVARRAPDFANPPADGAFDAVARQLAACLSTEIVVIDIVDADRAWAGSARAQGGGVSIAFHDHCEPDPADARQALRALVDPVVARERGFAFYVGVPLRSYDGCRLGTIAALDRALREPTSDEVARLQDAAAILAEMLDLRLAGFRLLAPGSAMDR